jgi:hypothetical protein
MENQELTRPHGPFSNDLGAAKTWENATINEAMQADARPSAGSDERSDLLKQYGCGQIQFSGTDDGLYERHLLFDDVVTPASAARALSGGCPLGQGCPFATLGSH